MFLFQERFEDLKYGVEERLPVVLWEEVVEWEAPVVQYYCVYMDAIVETTSL